MTYYRYLPGWNDLRDDYKVALLECTFLPGLSFIGDEKQQIIDAVQSYRDHGENIDIPHKESMLALEKLMIQCYLPGSIPTHSITARVLDDVKLHVNANIFHDIQEQAFMYKRRRQGSLYVFEPNRNSVLLLPERVMQAMCAYDWKQHDEQVDAWLAQLDSAMRRLEEDGTMELSKKVREHGADGIIMGDDGAIIVKKKRTLH